MIDSTDTPVRPTFQHVPPGCQNEIGTPFPTAFRAFSVHLFHMLLVAMATGSHKGLLQHIAYLKAENDLLRSKLPQRLTFTPAERRRLARAARHLGAMLRKVVTIVHPDTMLRWIREEKGTIKRVAKARGRRKTDAEVQKLVIQMARENTWGYPRILGELKKLGICRISKSTIKRILKAAGFDPGPQRKGSNWQEFLSRHAATLWQCDFLSRKVLTVAGWRDAYILVYLHVGTRQVVVTPGTLKPDEAWVIGQMQHFLETAKARGLAVGFLQHDNDAKFSATVRRWVDGWGVARVRSAVAAPVMNAFVERFMQSIQGECLDHFLIFGMKHFDYLAREYVAHYHEERPHQGLGQERICPAAGAVSAEPVDSLPLRSVRCKTRLGGLLKSYYRTAA